MNGRETYALEKDSKVRTSGWVKATRIIGLVMTLSGISGLGLGIYFFTRTNNFLETAVKTQGKILANEERSSDGDNLYVPIFSFADKKGKEHHARSSWGFYPPKYKVGDSISVVYDPCDPTKADIDSFTNLWLSSVMSFALSVPGLLFGLLFIFVVPIIIGHIQRSFEKKTKATDFATEQSNK